MSEAISTTSPQTLSKREALARLREEMQRAMSPGSRLVFGEGDPDARLAIVGEAPGREEERLEHPFVGPAGRLLNQLLAEVSLERERLWITNAVKFHPTAGPGLPGLRTRAPNAGEVSQFREWLFRELEIIGPGLILCLGNLPARVLIASRFKMNSDHGRWFEGPFGSAAMATFHPAYVLRQWGGPGEAWRQMREDFRKVKARYEAIASSYTNSAE